MSNSLVKAVNESQFTGEVENSSGVVLVDFHASWCNPCLALAPVVERLATRYEGRAKIVKVDVDENPNVAARYGVQGIPNLLFFKDGQVANQAVGFQGEEKLATLLDEVLKL